MRLLKRLMERLVEKLKEAGKKKYEVSFIMKWNDTCVNGKAVPYMRGKTYTEEVGDGLGSTY